MELKLDTETFEQHQELFVRELAEQIRYKLVKGGVQQEDLQDLTLEIAFSVTSILDDTSSIESDGVEVHPFMTFRTDDDQLIHCGENSYGHEFVSDTIKKLFVK